MIFIKYNSNVLSMRACTRQRYILPVSELRISSVLISITYTIVDGFWTLLLPSQLHFQHITCGLVYPDKISYQHQNHEFLMLTHTRNIHYYVVMYTLSLFPQLHFKHSTGGFVYPGKVSYQHHQHHEFLMLTHTHNVHYCGYCVHIISISTIAFQTYHGWVRVPR